VLDREAGGGAPGGNVEFAVDGGEIGIDSPGTDHEVAERLQDRYTL
jgi:hypothetical protein